MITLGIVSWLFSTVMVTGAIVIRANDGIIGRKLSDGAIFGAIIGSFYSSLHGLTGAMSGAIVGTMGGVLVGGIDNALQGAMVGMMVGGNFGPLFVAYVMANYYLLNNPCQITDETDPVRPFHHSPQPRWVAGQGVPPDLCGWCSGLCLSRPANAHELTCVAREARRFG